MLCGLTNMGSFFSAGLAIAPPAALVRLFVTLFAVAVPVVPWSGFFQICIESTILEQRRRRTTDTLWNIGSPPNVEPV